jgi:predicted nucleic acid-binding protein
VAAVLLKKERAGAITASEAEAILKAVLDLPLTLRGHSELVLEALDVGRREGLTAYDALFLALARRERADLLTGDSRLARRAAGDRSVSSQG